MQSLIRSIAVALRRREERRLERSLPEQFRQRLLELRTLAPPHPQADVVALVRLDDIGDYLLWRNFLPAFREYYAGKKLILIGNKVWQPVFQALDAAYADVFVALDKSLYHSDSSYRIEFWQQIRALGIAELICVSRTRPLLLDDCITIAAAAPSTIATENNFASHLWNRRSDEVYRTLIPRRDEEHEFLFNRYFSNAVTHARDLPERLSLKLPQSLPHHQIVCFIGASAKSKRWPLAHWVSLVRSLSGMGFSVLLSGGPAEREMATLITQQVPADNKVGSLSLMQTLECIAGAKALITGDTMAAHAGVGAGVPTLILANGVNAARFVAYREAGYEGVEALYSKAFQQYKGQQPFVAVSKDMESILPETVLHSLSKLLGHALPHS